MFVTRAMTRVLAGLIVVAVGAIAIEAVWLRPRHQEMAQRLQDRQAVLELARGWATLTNTYEPETFDDWTEQVAGLLTTRFRTEFEADTEALRPTIDQLALSSTGSVLQTGLADLDEDSAVVLVVADAATTSSQRDSARHFRWEVELAKVNGDWLVDDFHAVAQSTGQAPGSGTGSGPGSGLGSGGSGSGGGAP